LTKIINIVADILASIITKNDTIARIHDVGVVIISTNFTDGRKIWFGELAIILDKLHNVDQLVLAFSCLIEWYICSGPNQKNFIGLQEVTP
jgi:hypothetical protein